MNSAAITVMHLIAQLRLGAGRYVVDTAIEQARSLKHNVMVCVSADADEHWRTDLRLVSELACHGVKVQSIGDFFHRRPDFLYQSAARLRDLSDGINGSVIAHAHTAMAAAVGYWAQPDGLVATCHGWGAGRPPDFDLEDALAYQLCDSVTTYSSYWADRLNSDLGVCSPKIILMGLNLDRFPPLPKKRLYELPPARIVTVCELTPRKGVDILLNAMPMLWEQMPNAEIHIIGHGDAVDDLRLLGATIDPEMRRVFFHGAVANPYARLGDFDLFVLASRSDNLPVVLLEAMLARLPIVATAVGGIPELISAAKCGTIVMPESTAALAEGIIAALTMGRRMMASIGREGERYVRDRLDVGKTVLELERVYRDALQKHNAAVELAVSDDVQLNTKPRQIARRSRPISIRSFSGHDL